MPSRESRTHVLKFLARTLVHVFCAGFVTIDMFHCKNNDNLSQYSQTSMAQSLKHLWNHENMPMTGVVQANEC